MNDLEPKQSFDVCIPRIEEISNQILELAFLSNNVEFVNSLLDLIQCNVKFYFRMVEIKKIYEEDLKRGRS